MTPDASHTTIETPVGQVHVAATAAGLTHLVYPTRDHGRPLGDGSTAAAGLVAATGQQLREYFVGVRRTFDLPLALSGTAFQRAVWAALTAIPYGEVWSYGQLAARLGRPAAARAVGAAVGANPVSVIVPCHRVVGRDGRLTGYAGGLPAKSALLALEMPAIRADQTVRPSCSGSA